jgi:methylmalonyl-CoA mutase
MATQVQEGYRFEDWQAKATKDLKGKALGTLTSRSEDNIEIQPLYTAEHLDQSKLHPSRRIDATGQYQRTINAVYIDEKDPQLAREQALYALRTGASALCISWGGGAQERGVLIRHLRHLESFFEGIWLEAIPIYFELGEEYIEKLGILGCFLVKHYQEKASFINISLGIDPFTVWLTQGVLREKLAQQLPQLLAIYEPLKQQFPKLRLFEFNHGIYHHAGCDEAQDLAYSLSSAIALIRELEGFTRWSMVRCFEEIGFHLSVDSRFFHGIAKLRACKQLWARIQELCGLSTYQAPVIRLGFSQRFLSKYDPAVNILRNTAMSFTAFIGGASVVYSTPFDGKDCSELGFRLAKNTPMLLSLESHLHEVTDPAGGSFLVESLTTQLCEQAWLIFQGIEKIGFKQAIIQGDIQKAIQSKELQKKASVAKRRIAITGVSEFPLLTEKKLKGTEKSFTEALAQKRNEQATATVVQQQADHPLISPLEMRTLVQASLLEGKPDATLSAQWQKLCEFADIKALWMARQTYDCFSETIDTLKLIQQAGEFEALRDQGQAFYEKHGHYAKVFVASFGSLTQHLPRTSFIKNLLEAGGFEAILSEGEALSVEQAISQLRNSQASILVICGSDTMVDPLAISLLNHIVGADVSLKQAWRAGAIKDEALKQSYEQCAFSLTGTIALGHDMPKLLNELWAVYEENR